MIKMAGKKSAVEELQKLEVNIINKIKVKTTLPDVTPEELEDAFLGKSNEVSVKFNPEIVFEYFKTLAKDPEKAVCLAKGLAKRQTYRGCNTNDFFNDDTYHYELAKNRDIPFLGIAEKAFFHDCTRKDSTSYMLRSLSPEYSSYLYAIVNNATVKDNPKKVIDFFTGCYYGLEKEARYTLRKEAKKGKDADISELQQIEILINALKTGNFSKRSIESDKLVQEKKISKIPKYVDTVDLPKLVEYLSEKEGAVAETLGYITDTENKAIIIPVKGDKSWKKGVYVVTTSRYGIDTVDKVYKTETFLDDKELVKATTDFGKVIKPSKSDIIKVFAERYVK